MVENAAPISQSVRTARQIPSPRSTLLSDIFPAVSDLTLPAEQIPGPIPTAIALETAFPSLNLETERFRRSPEPLTPELFTLDDLKSNPTDPRAIAILAPLFARYDVRAMVDEYNGRMWGMESPQSIQNFPPPNAPSLRPSISQQSVTRRPNSEQRNDYNVPPLIGMSLSKSAKSLDLHDDAPPLPSPPLPGPPLASPRLPGAPSVTPSTQRTPSILSGNPTLGTTVLSLPRPSRQSTSETILTRFQKTPKRQQSLLNYSGFAHRRPEFELLKLHGRKRTTSNPELTAISSTGQTIAVLVKNQWWVFDPEVKQLLCTGFFKTKSTYIKASQDGEQLKNQHPLPPTFKMPSFTCCALSDEYLAIGAGSKVIIFGLRGDLAGRWLACDDIPNSVVKKMVFSSDGDELVALVSVDDKPPYDEARIYTTQKFRPPPDFSLLKSADMAPVEVKWTRDWGHNPSDMAFSRDGTMVGICTTHCDAKAKIHILKKEISTWRLWGTQQVVVHPRDQRDRTGLGLTGISLYVTVADTLLMVSYSNDEFLALSVDSANPDGADCYNIVKSRTTFRLEPNSQIVSGQTGTDNLAVAVSQPYDAVALLGKTGTYLKS